jgi:hypothetical protein
MRYILTVTFYKFLWNLQISRFQNTKISIIFLRRMDLEITGEQGKYFPAEGGPRVLHYCISTVTLRP